MDTQKHSENSFNLNPFCALPLKRRLNRGELRSRPKFPPARRGKCLMI
jgi:hypothetical protein